jgi:hypothetical protein
MAFTTTFLVLPSSLASAVILGFKCYREKKLLDAMPLIIS